jgi:DnaJ-class molecular chaperone
LASKFHPDRLAGKDQASIAAAHVRFIELKEAYELVVAAFPNASRV